jgi:hypothetical protein
MVAAKGFYENGSPFTGNVYRSKSGSNLNSECKSSVTSEYNNQYTSGGSYTIPADHKNVTQAFVAVIGGGGGGGKDTNDSGGGGGGGASSYATIAVSPGGRFTITIGRGGSGATSNGAGSNGGDSFISYTGSPSSKLISAAGGSAGGRNAGGNGGSAFSQSGSTSVSGGNGQPGQPTSGGYGGSAALLGSGKANPGNPISGCSGGWSGGAGGGGGSVPAFSIPSSGNTGVDATCSNTGRSGTTAGGGGGGGARSGNGGNGADGRARIQYTGTLTSPTWAELIDKIVSVYTDKAKRPPFLNEITDNVSSFRNNSTQTLSEFQTQLETQLTDSSYNERAISITDSCGNSL